MGTLDDAIREHLELKRRSGAPDTEVSRLESEAFGPVRKEAPRPAVEPEAAPDLPPPPAEEPVAGDEPATRIAEAVPPPPPQPPALDVPPAPAPAPPAPRHSPSDSWLEDDDFEPEHTAEFTAAEATDASGGKPPSDYVAPDEEEGDDLLEETPDFLQETPEHDRLWFEQKPPRDFDFDN